MTAGDCCAFQQAAGYGFDKPAAVASAPPKSASIIVLSNVRLNGQSAKAHPADVLVEGVAAIVASDFSVACKLVAHYGFCGSAIALA